jgi:hypothetical protein
MAKGQRITVNNTGSKQLTISYQRLSDFQWVYNESIPVGQTRTIWIVEGSLKSSDSRFIKGDLGSIDRFIPEIDIFDGFPRRVTPTPTRTPRPTPSITPTKTPIPSFKVILTCCGAPDLYSNNIEVELPIGSSLDHVYYDENLFGWYYAGVSGITKTSTYRPKTLTSTNNERIEGCLRIQEAIGDICPEGDIMPTPTPTPFYDVVYLQGCCCNNEIIKIVGRKLDISKLYQDNNGLFWIPLVGTNYSATTYYEPKYFSEIDLKNSTPFEYCLKYCEAIGPSDCYKINVTPSQTATKTPTPTPTLTPIFDCGCHEITNNGPSNCIIDWLDCYGNPVEACLSSGDTLITCAIPGSVVANCISGTTVSILEKGYCNQAGQCIPTPTPTATPTTTPTQGNCREYEIVPNEVWLKYAEAVGYGDPINSQTSGSTSDISKLMLHYVDCCGVSQITEIVDKLTVCARSIDFSKSTFDGMEVIYAYDRGECDNSCVDSFYINVGLSDSRNEIKGKFCSIPDGYNSLDAVDIFSNIRPGRYLINGTNWETFDACFKRDSFTSTNPYITFEYPTGSTKCNECGSITATPTKTPTPTPTPINNVLSGCSKVKITYNNTPTNCSKLVGRGVRALFEYINDAGEFVQDSVRRGEEKIIYAIDISDLINQPCIRYEVLGSCPVVTSGICISFLGVEGWLNPSFYDLFVTPIGMKNGKPHYKFNHSIAGNGEISWNPVLSQWEYYNKNKELKSVLNIDSVLPIGTWTSVLPIGSNIVTSEKCVEKLCLSYECPGEGFKSISMIPKLNEPSRVYNELVWSGGGKNCNYGYFYISNYQNGRYNLSTFKPGSGVINLAYTTNSNLSSGNIQWTSYSGVNINNVTTKIGLCDLPPTTDTCCISLGWTFNTGQTITPTPTPTKSSIQPTPTNTPTNTNTPTSSSISCDCIRVLIEVDQVFQLDFTFNGDFVNGKRKYVANELSFVYNSGLIRWELLRFENELWGHIDGAINCPIGDVIADFPGVNFYGSSLINCPTPTPTPTNTQTPTSVCCNQYTVIISQSDLNNSFGNTNTSLNGVVFWNGKDCNGNTLIIPFFESGTFTGYCMCESISFTHWSNNTQVTSLSGSEFTGQNCNSIQPFVTSTPTPTPTETIGEVVGGGAPMSENISLFSQSQSLTQHIYRPNGTFQNGRNVLVEVSPNSGGSKLIFDNKLNTWVLYIGNVLYAKLNPNSQADCPEGSWTQVFDGQQIYLGNSERTGCPPDNPSISPSATKTPTPTPSNTPSVTPTNTKTPIPTKTPTPTPTSTRNVVNTPFCIQCNIGFSYVRTQLPGVIQVGNLTSSCQITDYQIEWYSGSTLIFRSGVGTAFQYNTNHPVNRPTLSGTYKPILSKVKLQNGQIIENISGDCFGNITVVDIDCKLPNQPNDSIYTHGFQYDAGSNNLPPQSLEMTLSLGLDTKFLAINFMAFTVWDILKVTFVSEYYKTPIVVENIKVGRDAGIDSLDPDSLLKVYGAAAYKKVLTFTQFVRDANDYLKIEVIPNPNNRQTNWNLEFKCLDNFSQDMCMDVDFETPWKIIPESVGGVFQTCALQPIFQLSGACGIISDQNNDTSKYIQGWVPPGNTPFYVNTPILNAVTNYPLTTNITSCSLFRQPIFDICAAQIPSNNSKRITINKTVGNLKLEFWNFSDFKLQYDAYEQALNFFDTPYTNDPTNINYYKFLEYGFTRPVNETQTCGDGTIFDSLLIHRSTVVTTALTQSNTYVINLTMPKISNQFNLSNLGSGCVSCIGLDDVVNQSNNSSDTLPFILSTIVNNVALTPFAGWNYKILGSGTNEVNSRSSAVCFYTYQVRTFPMSGNPLTLIPSLSGQSAPYTNMKKISYFNNFRPETYLRYFSGGYDIFKPNPNNWNGWDYDIYTFPIVNFAPVGFGCGDVAGNAPKIKIGELRNGTLNILQPNYFVTGSTANTQSIYTYIKNL